MFCKHEWEKQSDTIVRPVPNEVWSNVSKINSSGNSSNLFIAKHIVILTCKKCGKIYKSVELMGGEDV